MDWRKKLKMLIWRNLKENRFGLTAFIWAIGKMLFNNLWVLSNLKIVRFAWVRARCGGFFFIFYRIFPNEILVYKFSSIKLSRLWNHKYIWKIAESIKLDKAHNSYVKFTTIQELSLTIKQLDAAGCLKFQAFKPEYTIHIVKNNQ